MEILNTVVEEIGKGTPQAQRFRDLIASQVRAELSNPANGGAIVTEDVLARMIDARLTNQYDSLAATKKTTFKRLNLEKGMYQELRGKKPKFQNFTQLLESMDPSKNYPGVGLDAFQRQLAARGLILSGPNAVTLAEFYDQPDSSVLFPEFIRREILLGRLIGRFTLKADDVVATTTTIDTGVYESAVANESSAPSAAPVGQGASFPEVTITISDRVINLVKRGMKIKQSYEHNRRIRVNKMAVFLRMVGWRLELDTAADAVNILINGNTGQSNAAFAFAGVGLTYNNLVDFWGEFEPYELKLMALDKAGALALFKLAEFKDPLIAAPWLTQGRPITPLGTNVKRHGGSTLTNKVLGVDNEFALEKIVESGSEMTETDKLIDGQWNEIVISFVIGYAKILANAAGLWTYA